MTAREGGRCHQLEINMVERDTVERERKKEERHAAELMVVG